ncbi:Nucleoporin GLE1 [Vanrija pseudolonga]|uniref:mRNA export factor GLE1 n=1 Tax=Vanrija pseudolonga TaxID=143232 RepID=A0AAF0Y856_9TREE|nr:Nucleoporin GLE1 [Vanrija pseudolonga]
MRFAYPESDSDEEDYVVDPVALNDSYSSDESDHIPDFTRQTRTRLGQDIRDMLASSGSEAESEDEVNDLILGGGGSGSPSKTKNAWRSPQKEQPRKPAPPTLRAQLSYSTSKKAGPSWKPYEPTVADELKESQSEYSLWLKSVEAEAWREGHLVAIDRRQKLRDINRKIRAQQEAARQAKRDRDAQELGRMLEGLTVRQKQEEDEMAKRFAQRTAQLWEAVDAAVKEAERRQAEEQVAAAEAARKQKEEEAARVAAAEKAAQDRKAEQERQAKEAAEGEAAAKAERDKQEADQAAHTAAVKAQEDKQRAAAAEQNRGSTEWSRWVEVQKKMKRDVIEVVKADKNLIKELRPGMRLMTRSLGQVINTKETIVRVTNDIHSLLSERLPAPVSASSPSTIDTLVPAYGYLLSHLSKALIKQAENEVSAKAEAGFPLARVVLGLILRGHGAFAQVLYARLVKKCPWVVPYLPSRAENQPREEYEKSTGRTADESLAEYIARMSGIATLYFAILQTPIGTLVPTVNAQPTPQQLSALIPAELRLPATWTWLASILRPSLSVQKPVAHLIALLLDTDGSEMVRIFGVGQVGKLLDAVSAALDAGKIPGDSDASQARLRLLLERWQQKRSLPPPEGRMWEV